MTETPERGPRPRVIKSAAELAEEARMADVSLAPKFKGKSPNEMAETIPDNLPGAARVEKVIVPNAKHTLVHIRQIHQVPGAHTARQAIERSRSENDVLMRSVQTDIHLILLKLKQNSGLQRIYGEGLTDVDGTEWKERLDADNKKLLKLRVLEMQASQALEHAREKMQALPENETDKTKRAAIEMELDRAAKLWGDAGDKVHRQDKFITQLLAAGEFARTYGITLVPAETEEGYQKAHKIRKEMIAPVGSPDDMSKNPPKRPSQADYDAVAIQGRENILLDIVSKKNDPFAVTIYGGGHDWKDNIKTWNTNHPDDTFSLVTITPNSYTAPGEKRE